MLVDGLVMVFIIAVGMAIFTKSIAGTTNKITPRRSGVFRVRSSCASSPSGERAPYSQLLRSNPNPQRARQILSSPLQLVLKLRVA